MKYKPSLLCSLLLLLNLAGAAPRHGAAPAAGLPDGVFVARVYYDDIADIALLAAYDVFEYNNRQDRYVLAALDASEFHHLQQQGFRPEVDEQETTNFRRVAPRLPGQASGIPGYPCYRTVEETIDTAQAIVANYPDLATWSDAGDSWEKQAGLGGYDLLVLRLANSAVPGPKPKFFITASIHAREYAPAELATRFAEYLVANYGRDPDATWLLDWREIHLMLHANPDGRKQAETGLRWRKNTNQNYCGASSTARGADLNRNFSFQWGCCGGSSGNQCSETYRGLSAASEPETQAIQDYVRAIFPDQRPDPLNEPAPADATGIYLDLHSYSELVLWPWGFTSAAAPNDAALRTLGRKLAYFNGYTPQPSYALYPTDGTTDDFVYGELGVAAYAFELGTAFFQSCSTFENVIAPANLPALLYAAKAARTPYLTPAGPDALGLATAPFTVSVGSPLTLTATIDDTRYSHTAGSEPLQPIAAAEFYVDAPPWDTAHNPVAVPMAPADGSFDSAVEDVVAVLDTSSLASGRHTLFVRGRDADGNWGAFSAVFATADLPVPRATLYLPLISRFAYP